jgi:hypothetical protein
MQKLLLLNLLSFYSLLTFSQAIDSVSISHCKYFTPPITEYGYTVDSFDARDLKINSWFYDSLWQPTQRSLFTYSNSGKLLYEVIEENADTGWITRRNYFYTYDGSDSLTEDKWFYYYYTSGAVSSTYAQKKTYQRDTINPRVTLVNFNYIDSTASWDSSSVYISSFDSLNKIILEEFYYRNQSGNFDLNDFIEFYYLPGGDLDYSLHSEFNSLTKEQRIYTPSGLLFEVVDSSWNYQLLQFDARMYEQNYYDSVNNLIGHSTNLILSGGMIDQLDTASYQYNDLNRLLVYSFQASGGGGYEGSYVYDSLQVMIQSHRCGWNHGDGLNCQDCDYTYFKAPFNPVVSEFSQPAFEIYPNPAELSFNITSDEKSIDHIAIDIYNLLGESVFFQKTGIQSGWKIEMPTEAAGIYFVHLTTSSGISVQKVLIK